jgi:Uma2 family endonuclease
MSSLMQPLHTPERYLALERAADHKSELINGRIYAMAGAGRRHNLIVLNIGAELRSRLRGRACEAYVSDMRVKVSATAMYTYPDVAALCERPHLEDDRGDTLLNPSVIMEVLSDSTEAYDRGEKFAHYRRLESLREYVLVSQNAMRVEQFVRRGEHWVLTEIIGPEGVLCIESLGCEIPLQDIYERVGVSSGELRQDRPDHASREASPEP